MFVKWFSVVTCTVCFLYTIYILYSLGHFLSNHNVTNETIVSSKEDESNVSLLWPLSTDMTLLSIFILQHSFMASELVKDLFSKFQVDYIERTVYNVFSAMTLHLLISKWEFISSVTLWKVDTFSNDVSWYTFTTLHVLAWIIIYSGCLMMDLSELAGLKQVYYKFSSRPCPIVMKSRGLLRYYMHMRHPSLTGFLIIFWIHPYMTLDRLLLASILTIYMGLMWTIDKEDYDYHAHLVKLKQNELL
ncbi:nurim homolog isoform X1 [Ceratina calcarata]|uniref:Nuclear envelope membrane protein n=1 Tax=Ceratina calcarata TaxID=156304 RepID=A0AAJ7IR20_9HYME|nr:nurim homolog isoform X1 [Ceratina calcarata]